MERAFGQMVSRFRRLKFLNFLNIELSVNACIAACALHNFCVFEKEELFDDEIPLDNEMDESTTASSCTAKAFRQRVVDELYNSL